MVNLREFTRERERERVINGGSNPKIYFIISADSKQKNQTSLKFLIKNFSRKKLSNHSNHKIIKKILPRLPNTPRVVGISLTIGARVAVVQVRAPSVVSVEGVSGS